LERIRLNIIGLSYSQAQTGAYALVLGEEGGERRLPIIIGSFEAQAIAIELENMRPSRPLTHDVFKTFASSFDITIDEVLIYNLVEGVFYAKLMCRSGDKTVEIDARTSDAIALALRFKAPVFALDKILDTAGVIMEGDNIVKERPKKKKSTAKRKKDLTEMSTEDLEKELGVAIDKEDYERASRLRDEIDRRG